MCAYVIIRTFEYWMVRFHRKWGQMAFHVIVEFYIKILLEFNYTDLRHITQSWWRQLVPALTSTSWVTYESYLIFICLRLHSLKRGWYWLIDEWLCIESETLLCFFISKMIFRFHIVNTWILAISRHNKKRGRVIIKNRDSAN